MNHEIFEMPPLEYADHVEIENKENRVFLQEELNGIYNFANENSFVITTVGSDGKNERYLSTRHEIEFLTDDPQDSPEIAQRINDVYTFKTGKKFSEEFITFNGLPIVRKINTPGEILSYANNKRENVFPDRILNAQLLIGPNALYLAARRQVLEEFNSEEGTRIVNTSKNQLKNYKRATQTGIYRQEIVFDEENGYQFYNYSEPEKQFCFGFKVPLLRPVQRKLDILTSSIVKAPKTPDELAQTLNSLAKNLPTNTLKRMEYFANIFIDPEQLKKLAEAYYWSMREYHKAQKKFSNTREFVKIGFNLDEFYNVKKTIIGFTEIK